MKKSKLSSSQRQYSRYVIYSYLHVASRCFHPTVWTATIQSNCISNNVLSDVPTASPPLRSNTKSDRTLSQIRTWLIECNSRHDRCRSLADTDAAASKPVPTRLLDVGDAESTTIRLVETAGRSAYRKYATLRYAVHVSIAFATNVIKSLLGRSDSDPLARCKF